MESQDPGAELSAHVSLAHRLDHLDAGVPEDLHPFAVDARVRVAHADHDATDASVDDDAGAGRRPSVERARLERRVHGGSSDAPSVGVGLPQRADLRVVLAGALGVASPEEVPTFIGDDAADPWVVPGRAAGPFGLVHREVHPLVGVAVHRPPSVGAEPPIIEGSPRTTGPDRRVTFSSTLGRVPHATPARTLRARRLPARTFAVAALVATSIHCGGSSGAPPTDTGPRDASSALEASLGNDRDGTFLDRDASSSKDAVSPADAPSSDATTGGPTLAIGEWTDGPGVCPSGTTKVDITTQSQLASAARGESPYDSDPPATCYFIHNGTYATTGVVLYVLKGGVAGAAPRAFVGESRAGVVIHGRGNVADGVSDVLVTNLTFDLTGYTQSGAFNTLNLGNGNDVTVDHVTFTGDCATGLQGGHIETNGTSNVLVDSCLIEKFGQCAGTGGTGHEDHGVYLASGSHIVLRNNVIRLNSSRGVQMYTQMGQYGTLDAVTLERNRIYQNGHRDYEDGVVINSSGTGPITHVTIRAKPHLPELLFGHSLRGRPRERRLGHARHVRLERRRLDLGVAFGDQHRLFGGGAGTDDRAERLPGGTRSSTIATTRARWGSPSETTSFTAPSRRVLRATASPRKRRATRSSSRRRAATTARRTPRPRATGRTRRRPLCALRVLAALEDARGRPRWRRSDS